MAGHRNHGNSVSRLPDGYPSGGKVSVAQDRGPEEPDELNKPKRITVGRHGVIGAEQPRRRAALIIACIKAAEEAVPLPRTARVAGGPTVTFHLPVCWMASMAMPPATMSCVAPIAEALVKEEAVAACRLRDVQKEEPCRPVWTEAYLRRRLDGHGSVPSSSSSKGSVSTSSSCSFRTALKPWSNQMRERH